MSIDYPISGHWYKVKEDQWHTYPQIFQNVLFEYRANTPFGEIFLVGEGEYIGQNRVHMYKDQMNIPMSCIVAWRYLPEGTNETTFCFEAAIKEDEGEH